GLRLPRHFEIQRLQAIKHAWSRSIPSFDSRPPCYTSFSRHLFSPRRVRWRVCGRVVPRSKAKAFFTVSKMVESEKDVRLLTFLNATSLLEADLPVLRYWTTGMT